MRVVLDNLDLYVQGIKTTVGLTLLSYAFALVLGTIVAGCRVSPVPPLRFAGTLWVEIVRNTPLPLLMLLFFFGLTKVGIGPYEPFPSAVVVLSGYTSTFIAETLRSGINAVAAGQGEAARSIGLTFPQTMRLVVLPQAFRTVVAPLGSIFIALTKNSSIASIIAVADLSHTANNLITFNPYPVEIFLGAAVGYLLLTLPSGLVVGAIERRVAIKR